MWSGLRTYYAWLVKQIKLQDLLFKGNWLTRTSDVAIMYPMCEMAGNRFTYIDDVMLVHNEATLLNDHKVDGKFQSALEFYFRQLPPYNRLDVKPVNFCKKLSVTVIICNLFHEADSKFLESITHNACISNH
jgi:hypothetical protein